MSPTPVASGGSAGEPTPTLGRGAWGRFRRHRLAVLGAGVLVALTVACLVGPFLLPYEPDLPDLTVRDQAPSWAHPLGTDALGRDQLARILDGGRLTLATAGTAVAVAMALGTLVGITAGYLRGVVDAVLMRVVDVFYSVPGLFVVILLVTVLGAGFGTIVVSIALFSWMNTARLVRATALSVMARDFVEAAVSSGVGGVRLAVRHVLPNLLSAVIVTATLGIGLAVLSESALSFLGLGFPPPAATWGGMLAQSQSAVVVQGRWWQGLFPGLAIFLCVLAANVVGDGLRDALDPRHTGSRGAGSPT